MNMIGLAGVGWECMMAGEGGGERDESETENGSGTAGRVLPEMEGDGVLSLRVRADG